MTDTPTLTVLLVTACSIAFIHTLVGVDHSLPFVVMGRARGWSLRRTLSITALCGLGHVASSVLLGSIGIGLGTALERLEWIESTRGGWAAWLLIGFGIAYAAHGLLRGRRTRGHSHAHLHADLIAHEHGQDHREPQHGRAHGASGEQGSASSLTVWALFVIFVLGPCEPLIPLLMAPAALLGPIAVVWVAGLFAVVTVGTMLAIVAVAFTGLSRVRLTFIERHAHALAGCAIAGSGLAIAVLGL